MYLEERLANVEEGVNTLALALAATNTKLDTATALLTEIKTVAEHVAAVLDTPDVPPPPPPPPPPPVETIRRNSGIYVLLDGVLDELTVSDPPASSQNILKLWQLRMQALASNPKVRGYKMLLRWSLMEGSAVGLNGEDIPGNYDTGINIIKQLVAWAKEYGNKKLILSFQHVHFGGYPPTNLSQFLPSYIWKNPSGQYGYRTLKANGGDGVIAKIDQPATADRVIAKFQAYGAVFKDESTIEMVQMDETSVATLDTDFSQANFNTQFVRIHKAMRAAWPNTQARACVNYAGSEDQCAQLIKALVEIGCAIGGPDTYRNQGVQANRIFSGMTAAEGGAAPSSSLLHDYRGEVDWVTEFQSPELYNGRKDNATPAQLFAAATQGYSYTYRDPSTGATSTRTMRPVLSPYIIVAEMNFGSPNNWLTTLDWINGFDTSTLNLAYPSMYPKE